MPSGSHEGKIDRKRRYDLAMSAVKQNKGKRLKPFSVPVVNQKSTYRPVWPAGIAMS